MNVSRLGALVAGVIASAMVQAASAQSLPAPLADLAAEDHELPRSAEQYYHPLSRLPVVDAMLADVLWSPGFAERTSADIRSAGSVTETIAAVQALASLPRDGQDAPPVAIAALREAWDDDLAVTAVEAAWGRFLAARRLAAAALSAMPEGEADWWRANPGRWFFTDENRTDYRYLTCDTTDHLRMFRSVASVDQRVLARAAMLLARAIDGLRDAANDAAFDDLEVEVLDWTDPETGATLRIAGRGNHRHVDDVDLLIDLGGDDWWTNNAGGTTGTRPAALAVDLGGDDCYEGTVGVQGAGWMGVGALADVAGDDLYRAEDLAQGAAFLGHGLLFDVAGDDRYLGRHFTQAASGFGTAVLRDDAGDDAYESSGMSGGLGATGGVAVLADRDGDDRYRCGRPRSPRYTLDYGMGLGAGIGVRDWPWTERASFYGGLGLLDDATGRDRYEGLGAGLGGAYCLAGGIVVEGEGDDDYHGITDSFGASIHLGAAVFLDQAGDDRYRGDNSLLGCGGDRGHGVFVDFAGDDRYLARSHGLGTGRKPKAVGLFVEVAGDDEYAFGPDSMTATWRPSNPENWAWASFVDLGGRDAYRPDPGQDDRDGLDRGNDRSWTFGPTGRGEDAQLAGDTAAAVRAFWPASPRSAIRYEPDDADWCTRVSAPLVDATWTPETLAVLDRLRDPTLAPDRDTVDSFAPPVDVPTDPEAVAGPLPSQVLAWIAELGSGTLDLDARRRRYEQLDLLRFAGGETLDWSPIATLLDRPGAAPSDLLAFAGIWSALDRTPGAVARVADALVEGRIPDPYARAILVRMVGRCGDGDAARVLRDRVRHDPDPLVRRRAAFHLGRLATEDDLPMLAVAATDDSELVRCSVAGGLRDNPVPGADAVLRPLLDDPDLFTRRAAAVALLSRGDATMVERIMDEMAVASIDTGWNYGRNLFVTMAEYLGPQLVDELGTELSAWRAWWAERRDTHDLRGSIAANRAAIEERLDKAPSSE